MKDPGVLLEKAARRAPAVLFTQETINKAKSQPDADLAMAELQDEGLGILVAQYVEWCGVAVMRIFRAALEEANYHQEAAKVQKWIQLSCMTDEERLAEED